MKDLFDTIGRTENRIEKITQQYYDGHANDCSLDWKKCKSLAKHFQQLTQPKFTADKLKSFILETFDKQVSGSKNFLQRVALTGNISFVHLY
jgi:hypothetical protein